MALTFWFDFSSTYSYLAAMRLEEEAAAAGVTAVWQPFLLGPIFQEAGYNGSPNLAMASKAQYMWVDLARRARRRGVAFQKPAVFPQKGVAPARAALALSADVRPAFCRAVFAEEFAHGRNVAEPEVLADAARAAGLDAEQIAAAAGDPSAKEALFAAGAEAKRLGLFGAPTFVTSDGALFWGDDRMEDALSWEVTGDLPVPARPHG